MNPVSIVVCTHNGERFLPLQLESLRAQTAPPGEILFSDDASSDGTRELLQKFAASSDVPVRVIHNNPGLGFRDNFLYAARAASQPWVAFCDQDDVWSPHKLEHCLPAMGRPGVTQVAHTATLIDEAGRPTGLYDQGIAETALRPPLYYDVWKTFSGFSMIVRKRLLEAVSPQLRFAPHEEPGVDVLAHDRWSFFLSQTTGHTAEIAEPLVAYRQHTTNVFGTSRRTTRAKLAAFRGDRERALTGQRRLVREAEDMLRTVAALPAELDTDPELPAFDRARAMAFYRAVLERTSRRAALYADTRATGLAQVLRGATGDLYRTKNGGARNWESWAKDLALLTTTRRHQPSSVG